MSDVMQVIRAHMKSLVSAMGCYDAVAETFNARWGSGASKGTVSKKMSGQLDWTIADIIALEDALGRYQITRVMARRLESQVQTGGASLIEHSSIIAKESGEAISAILSAQQSSCANERVDALKEIDEAMDALRHARKRLEGIQ